MHGFLWCFMVFGSGFAPVFRAGRWAFLILPIGSDRSYLRMCSDAELNHSCREGRQDSPRQIGFIPLDSDAVPIVCVSIPRYIHARSGSDVFAVASEPTEDKAPASLRVACGSHLTLLLKTLTRSSSLPCGWMSHDSRNTDT